MKNEHVCNYAILNNISRRVDSFDSIFSFYSFSPTYTYTEKRVRDALFGSQHSIVCLCLGDDEEKYKIMQYCCLS